MQAAISRNSHCFVVDGTSALKTEIQTRLYVIDGGRASMSEQKARSNAGASAFPFFATVVFAAASLLIAAIFISVDATRAASTADTLGSTGIAHVVVAPGDTIWDLAESHRPSGRRHLMSLTGFVGKTTSCPRTCALGKTSWCRIAPHCDTVWAA